MKVWIIILISSEFVINIACQSEIKYDNTDEESFGNVGNFDGPEFQALFPDAVGIAAETYIEETKDDNRRNFKIVPGESESSIDGVQPYMSDFSYEYELVKDDVKPFFGDLSIEDSHESIDNDEEDDESTKSERHKRAGPDEFDTAYEDFVHKNFGNHNMEAQIKPAKAHVSSEDDEHDHDEATDDGNDEYERGKRLSEQATEDHKNSKHCKIKYKGERECSVCRNSKTGEESESCSYSSNPAPKGYSFKHKKNYDKYDKNDDDDNDNNNDHEDDSGSDDDDDNGGEHHQYKQLHPTQFHPKNSSPQPIPYHRYKPSGSYEENYQSQEPHYKQQKYKHDDHSDDDHDHHDDYDEDDHVEELAEHQNHDHLHPSHHHDHSHPPHHHDHPHPPHHPTYHDKGKKPIKHHKPSKKPKKHNPYHSPSAEYYFDQIYHSTSPLVTKTSGVDRVLEELKNRDWSKCKKTFKDGFTCYLCKGKSGESNEECMSFGDEDSQSPSSNSKDFPKKEIESKTKSKVKTKLIETTKTPIKTAQIKSASKRSFVITKAPKPEEDETDETEKRTIKRMVSLKIHEDATDTGPKKIFYQKSNIF